MNWINYLSNAILLSETVFMEIGWLSGLMMRYHSRSLVQIDASLVVTEYLLAIWQISSGGDSKELVAVKS